MLLSTDFLPGWSAGLIMSWYAGPGCAAMIDEGIGGTRSGRRILIVEDEWFVATQIESCLADAGFEIAGTAADAATAIALAERERPDLVLMDIRLEGAMDGIAAAREIADRFQIHSLFISAHTDESTVNRTLAAQPAGWLPKPFTEGELLQAVAAALANP